jgi:hypothetical protein
LGTQASSRRFDRSLIDMGHTGGSWLRHGGWFSGEREGVIYGVGTLISVLCLWRIAASVHERACGEAIGWTEFAAALYCAGEYQIGDV